MSRTGILHLFERPLPYAAVREAQEVLARLRLEDAVPDLLLVLRHEPVITLGRRGRRDHLRVSEETLRRAGIALEPSPRGGDITFHGPGQVVAYPIVKLAGAAGAARGFLAALQDAAIATARACGVDAFPREVMSGAWCASGKLAAIGFRITRGVTSHGLALNVAGDLAGFQWIHGCGLPGEPVATLAGALGTEPAWGGVARVLAAEIGRALGIDFQAADPASQPTPPALASLLPA